MYVGMYMCMYISIPIYVYIHRYRYGIEHNKDSFVMEAK